MTADQARRIGELLGVPVASVHGAGAQHGYQHLTARLADGRQAFVKAAPGGDEATAEVTELGCHPGRVTDELRSSYRREREIEIATLTEPGLLARIESLGLTLASYHDWPGGR